MKIKLLLPVLFIALAGTARSEELRSKDHPDGAARALAILSANCPAEKLDKFKFYIGSDGFKFDVREQNYGDYSTQEILARNTISAIYMVKEFDRRGPSTSCDVEMGVVEPAALMPK
jgi:hypothetical protein